LKRREEAVEQGEAVAQEERRRLNLGGRPIADMGELLGREEIWAASAQLPEELSGLFLSHEKIGMAILVNDAHVRGRRRFSYAHEYGHALMDRATHPLTVTSRKNSSELIERRANAFAAAFLMPPSGVREALEALDRGSRSRETFSVWDVATGLGEQFERRNAPGSQTIGYQDVAYLANEFMVSYDAAAYRMSELGYINRVELKQLLLFRTSGHQFIDLLRLQNPDSPDPEDRPRLTSEIARLAVEAVRREAISGGRLLDICEKLGITEGERLLELARTTQG
jgi:Zn-dependent peptidase ImmA (M78 family)